MPEQEQDCPHLELKKLADTMFETFPSFKAGARFYHCIYCGVILKTTEPVIHEQTTTTAGEQVCQ
jgi:hypothetical protein